MNTPEMLHLAALLSAPAFFRLIALAALGTPLIAFFNEIFGQKSRLLDNFGRQTSTLAMVTGVITLIIGAGAAYVAYTKYPALEPWLANGPTPLNIVLGCFVIGVLLSIIYARTWKPMRKNKGAHLFIGFLTALVNSATAICGTTIVYLMLMSPTGKELASIDLEVLSSSLTYSILLPLIGLNFTGTLASGSALACAYLIIRRNRDDWGRDYYATAMRAAAKWALITMHLHLATQGWLAATLPQGMLKIFTGTALLYMAGATVGTTLVSAMLWIPILRSEHPMRLKGLVWIAVLFTWLATIGLATCLFNLLSMI